MKSWSNVGCSRGFRYRRYECKYLVSETLAGEIANSIRPFVDVDPYALGSPDRSYDIASVYLDAPDLRLFRETREGLKRRLKLRIRSYCERDDAPAFLEIKRRYDRLVLKGRARVGHDAVAVMLAGGVPDTSGLAGEELACFEEFVAWTARWLAQPVIWVKYRREAYVGAHDPNLRVTLDRDLVCAPSSGPDCRLPACDWRPLETRGVILELKFTGSFPAWMSRLVQRHELQRRSYSKYCNAVLRGLDAWTLPASEAWAVPFRGR
ncbi:polyphosphate polymerase domain-containing protein [bacterium]|nr:polyphosphate polymerase domain-containing protein [bacterium]